jgi:nitroreductase
MPLPNPPVLEFLLSRRSRPAKTLKAPAPSRDELRPILQAALRCPDHGKLEPWRLIVLERVALQRLAGLVAPCGARLGKDEADITKATGQFANSPLAVAVIEVQKTLPKVPPIEQSYSAGAVCLGLLNAALASGWGANWLSGWASHDREFLKAGLQLAPHEKLAGFIHIGTETSAPPERPRPDIEELTIWVVD